MNPTSQQVLGAVFDPNSPVLISGAFLFLILKGMVLIGFGLYVIFAFAVIRQIALMTRTLQTGLNSSLHLFGWVHFAIAVCIWIFAFLTL